MALRDNLISWYDLEADGTDALGTNTLSTNTNNSFGSGSGKVGNGVSVNSNDANHSVLALTSGASGLNIGTGNLSISLWFNRQGSGHVNTRNPPIIFLEQDVNSLIGVSWFASNGQISLYQLSGGSVWHYADFANVNITTAGWHHLVAIRNAANNGMLLYIDGVQQTETSALDNGTNVSLNIDKISIGGWQLDATDEFCGYVDSVGIWTRALDSDDIAELYNSGNGLNYAGTADVIAPTVTTQAVSSIAPTTATGNGNITATGGANCTRRGFCYLQGASGDPTTANSTAYDDGDFGTGTFTKSITGLSAGTSYRVRAYAVNSAGTAYGSTVDLTTKNLYTVTCASGTFTLTGYDATIKQIRKVICATGAFTLTGFATTIKQIRKITASVGSFILTGYDATITYIPLIPRIICETGAFVLTGGDATIKQIRRVTCGTGSFVLTGYAVAIKRIHKVFCATGTFVLTGYDATIKQIRRVTCEAGAFVLTGYDLSIKQIRKIVCATGSFILTGFSVTFRGIGSWIWTNEAKSSTTFTNEAKATTNFTNEAKPTTTWTNETK